MKHSRLKISARVACVIALAIATGLFYAGCSEQYEGVQKPNQSPRVWLSSAPPEGTTQKYIIQMFWGGWDPDGEIAYYEYAITDNEDGPFNPRDTTRAVRGPWDKVYSTDSTFLFTADQLGDTNTTNPVTEFLRSHTFFIRAVDRGGLASREPAYRSFTARTLSPRITVTQPSTRAVAQVPGISTYRWTAIDYVDDIQTTQDPESVSWILESTATHDESYDQTLEYIRSLPVDDPKWEEWGGWVWYRAPQDSGKFWTTDLLANDTYVFAIRAKDEAGAITPVFDRVRNVRYVQVAPLNTGPQLRVRNVYMGSVSTVLCNEPLKSLEVPEGVPVRFCWDANADYYGGAVSGYRYGWDIENLDNPDEWEIDYVPLSGPQACSPTRTFFSGPHRFTVEVIDNNELCARVEIMVDIVRFTMSRNLLVVDDYREGSQIGWDDPSQSVGLGTTPSDVQHDRFWEYMFENLVDFNPTTDVIQVQAGLDIPLAELADYKSIVWSVDSDYGTSSAALPTYIRYFPKDGSGGARNNPNVLSLFMEAGGHVMISGRHPTSVVINQNVIGGVALRFPIIWKYELEGNQNVVPTAGTPTIGDESFTYRDLCLETMEYAVADNRLKRGTAVGRNCNINSFRVSNPDAARIHTMRAANSISEETRFNFPRLDLRVEATGMGSEERAYHVDKKGMTVELFNAPYFLEYCTSGTPATSRACFQPIYGLTCIDTAEVISGAPVAFWSSQFADRLADAPDAVRARSVVFGFPLVYFEPDSARVAVEEIIFKEWKLPDSRE